LLPILKIYAQNVHNGLDVMPRLIAILIHELDVF